MNGRSAESDRHMHGVHRGMRAKFIADKAGILPPEKARRIIVVAAGPCWRPHRERDTMKKLMLALGVVCATAFTAGSASAFPGSSGLIDALSNQNMIQDVQYCRRGAYWCPGRISGCCPVGWACGSTTCYRSANRSTPAARQNKVPGR
jgi:hypothetical protein